ncbi:MAG: hypothetical protein U9Q95_04325 [Candidatus Eisenbacteria bacterium]|nr:hypothetical protein [Candidatus Eisenbacteria bacterium]
MNTFRRATLIILCLGMALPSAHALALCMDSEGNVALEVAVGGVCSGSRARGNDTDRAPAGGFGRAADVVDCCGGCTDVVIGGGGAAVPPPALSGKHKLSRPGDEAVDPIDARGSLLPRASGTRLSSSAPIPERPSTSGSVVLRL